MATKKNPKAQAKASARAPATKKTAPSASRAPKRDKMSALDAAARVLEETKEPMSCPELIEAMATKGYWKSPGGKTPEATLYAALTREITTKKDQSRFEKCAPGRFRRA
jgi:hypothetical protein